jgi:hypothetical protein
MSVQISETNADFAFYVFGKVLHTWSIAKELKAAV